MARSVALALLLPLAGCGSARAAGEPAPRGDALAPGVVHRFELRPEGPWAVHVVEVDPRACGVTVGSVKGLDRVEGVETTRSMAVRSRALLAVNADFFRARPFGVPEGPQVAGGEVVTAEGSHGPSVSARFSAAQGVFGTARGGVPFVGEGAVEGRAWSRGGDLALARVNAPPGPDSLALYTRFAGEATPADTGAVEVVLRVVHPSRAAGDTAVAVVVRLDTVPAGVALEEGAAVLAGRGTAGTALRRMARGDTVRWTLPVRGAPGAVTELVGGFPLLLRGGRAVLDRVPAIRAAFAHERHPRTAVALRADGTVLLVVVDGRQPEHSAGMTLPELTELLRELGAVDALNLDGGGSTTLVVRGRVANRPSDPEERPVTSALVVWSDAAGCATGGGAAGAAPAFRLTPRRTPPPPPPPEARGPGAR